MHALPSGAPPLSPAVARALRTARAHDGVDGVGAPRLDMAGSVSVDIRFRLGLPIAWSSAGRSPNGVLAVEPVTFTFPPDYPFRSPQIELRREFDRCLAHVQPGPPSERPQPCVYDGLLGDLLAARGFGEILNQTLDWLEKAATGRLIDPAQGWEPVRRDTLSDIIVADAPALRAMVGRKPGHAWLGFDYLVCGAPSAVDVAYHGAVGTERVPFNPSTFPEKVAEEAGTDSVRRGRSLALFLWPGCDPTGQPVIADKYRPETVSTWAELVERAGEYGCRTPLVDAFAWFGRCAQAWRSAGRRPLVVILCARRPFRVIGEDSELELVPYLVRVEAPRALPNGPETEVRPAGHRHVVSPALLRRMSGEDDRVLPPWTLVGCGSLGSKIAIHAARSGRGPGRVVDPGILHLHNMARHGLVPQRWAIPLPEGKAHALAGTLSGFAQTAEAVPRSIVAALRDGTIRASDLRRDFALVNATASLPVREFLASRAAADLPRVIETTLYGAGRVGLVTVEGLDRNPNTADLVTEAYAAAVEDAALADAFLASTDLARVPIGMGCGSTTMMMSDARLSAFAAPMWEVISRFGRDGMPKDGGRVLFGTVGEDGLSLAWTSRAVAPVNIVRAEAYDGDPHEIRISARVCDLIDEEVRRWPGVETGGVLVGRYSEATSTFHAVDVLPAPEDSVRSATEFVLGTTGLRGALEALRGSSRGTLYCLGTWHSHLVESGPSPLDRATAQAMAVARLTPSALLIRTPTGFRALLCASVEAAVGASNDVTNAGEG